MCCDRWPPVEDEEEDHEGAQVEKLAPALHGVRQHHAAATVPLRYRALALALLRRPCARHRVCVSNIQLHIGASHVQGL